MGCASSIPASAVPVFAAVAASVDEQTLTQNDDSITIEIKHVSGVAERDSEWCLNNIIIIDSNGAFVSHSKDGLFHQWMKGSAICTVQCPASVRFIAFSSQDMQMASLNVTSRFGSSASSLSLPSNPVETVHWSNGNFGSENWNADCNANERTWAYTVVPLLGTGSSKSNHDDRSSFFSSWLGLKQLRS